MSASTAANPSSAANAKTPLTLDSNSKQDIRRRAVAITNKKSSTEMVLGGINGVSNDKVTVCEKDLSHTIRGESVLERPKDLLEVKKGLVSPNIASRRKKGISKPEKPKGQLLLGILIKTCLLLGVLLWLGLLIWKWYDMLSYNRDSPFAALEYEGRLSEVEASLKKTAKMLQVQVEVVDRKVGSEAGTVTRDLKKQIEEKHALLEKELKTLERRTDNLDKSVRELRDTGFLSKEEFEGFLSELNKRRSSDGSDRDLSLDDIMNVAKEIVEKEIEKHAADGLGRVDYALASGGARVVRHSEPYILGKSSNWLAIGKGRNGVQPNAQKMLEPSFGEPGQCFALQGSSGFVEIRLRTGIIPEAVTLEHVSKSVAFDRTSAPKDCRVSAWFEGPDDNPSDRSKKMLLLTEFTYDLEKSNAQTFNVETIYSAVVNMVRLDFSSNHGSSSLTCIYRFRVHGYEPSSSTNTMMQA
ncbi:SUN domain-containing protein 1-like [Phoenix dactylifera]|uniref:SUN domain-containing protein 1-like n=1 Tax=Phoenix dactylifera TaxID=42345 RepID=A0A8B7BWG2_PHODC|nr:SUN domain-containing protein 1-like [Phoenix dactylifera]XP_008786769.2 SUN domain-containing protein 1-like [Phoenix dactylifera]